jgi:hypothetical protein
MALNCVPAHYVVSAIPLVSPHILLRNLLRRRNQWPSPHVAFTQPCHSAAVARTATDQETTMNIEGPSLRDLQSRGIHALREHLARAFPEQPALPADAPHNAADLIESGDKLAASKLNRDVAA